MEKNNFRSKNWTLITIDNPILLEGDGLFEVIQLLLSVINFNFITLDDIEGSGKTGSFD